jgi:signal peptidase II
VATLVIVWLLVSLRSAGGGLNTFGIGCVIGGAAGNLIDRAFRQEAWLRGAVVDFIDLQWFPIFNIADMAINIGAGALILNAILGSLRAKQEVAQEAVMSPHDEPNTETDEIDVTQSADIDDEADA